LEGVRVEMNQAAWCFQAEPGERVRVCGAAASGKSTLLRVAAGLIAPVTGRVLLEGLPLETIKDLHRVIQLVSSDVPLVRGTVGENLRMARISDSGPAVEALAKALGIESGTSLFPDGLETPVGDGGSQLSSGARARVSLGRALMAQPRLLLIDDPALMLDRENERILHRALSLTRATVLHVGGPEAGDNARESIWNLSPLEQILRWEKDSTVEPALTA
jgi:ABC-type transport system involved in cytochrome bd biosynthesis fused ATPase/permease subunit